MSSLPPPHPKPQGGFTEIPSKRLLNSKLNTFEENKKSDFQRFYQKGQLPCKINHGSVNNKLVWDQSANLDTMSFDPLILHFFDGLREKSHPYDFIVREALKGLLSNENAKKRMLPLLGPAVEKLRLALGDSTPSVFKNSLIALNALSECLGEDLNPHLKFLLSPISKNIAKKELRSHIMETLAIVEKNGGPSALAQIKIKIPTYVSTS